MFGIAGGNILETLVSAWLLQRVVGMRPELDRVRDVSFALDALQRDPALAARVDTNRIGIAGHSYGSWTVLAAAGQKLLRKLGRHLEDEEDLIIPLILDRGEGPLGVG